MTFDVDRSRVTEGDVVEVRWDCTGAERVELKIDNGFKASVMDLDIVGSKRFRLNRSKGRTALTITAWKNGKHGSKTIKVRVLPMATTRAETVDERGRSVSPLRDWWQRMQPRWRSLPADKQVAARVAMILCGVLLLGVIVPSLLVVGLLALLGYLIYVVLRR